MPILPGEAVMKCFYRKGASPTLHVKIDDETEIHLPKGNERLDRKKLQGKRFHLDAVIKVESLYVYMSDDTVSVQVKLYEGKVLEEKPREPRKRLLR